MLPLPNMWRNNRKIGFDDRLMALIMIPLTSFLVPVVFFGMRFQGVPLYTVRNFWTTLLITTALWLGNRYIMIWSRTRYPVFKDIRRRMIVQSLLMLVFTLAITNSLGSVLHDYCGLTDPAIYPGRNLADIIINSNSAALFCVLAVGAIYESKYFINELRKSVEEKEMLKRESLKAQLNALKTQVNPHFLFNNLNTLSSIIPEDPKKATEFVQQLSRVYRHILEVRDERSIPLNEELDVLKAYAFLLKTRFGNNLDISINVPDEKRNKKIVPLSLQILMENAIKHNIVSSDKPLKVEVFAENGRLVVSNTLQKKNQITESTGIGLDNIRNRCRLLGSGQVVVTENETNFMVSIPLIEN
ncbi:MAG: histidine kinase [Sphingobacteriales bacterium]|nr:histidine kinase [Sphingobacteriales bacterium]